MNYWTERVPIAVMISTVDFRFAKYPEALRVFAHSPRQILGQYFNQEKTAAFQLILSSSYLALYSPDLLIN
jgi:hypothetical protein